MSEYFVGTTGSNSQTTFESLTTSEVLDDLGLNTTDAPTFSGLFLDGSGSTIFSVDGSNGRLFGVTDEVTGTVFSVNDAAGLPIVEVESTADFDKITIGEYGSDLLVLSGQTTAEVTGSQIASESWVEDQGYITDAGNNFYLTGIEKSSNTLNYKVQGASDVSYTFGANAFNSTTIPSAANNATITISAGTALGGGGEFTTDQNSEETITINHSNTSRSDTTSASSLSFGDTFTSIDSITSNAQGHITAENTVTYTLPSETYSSASDLLTAIKTVDSVGSDLDADKLDSQEGSYYLNYNNFSNTPTIPSAANNTTITLSGGTEITTSIGNFTTNQSTPETLTINHADVSRTNTTSTASPAFGGTFTVVDGVTSNTRGHVTAENVKTITLPSLGTTSTTALAGNTTVNDVSEANLKSRLAALDSNDTIYIGDAGDDTTVVIRGTLQVDGSTTTVNSTTITVDDKNIELGSVASPSDSLADGGGITLKGSTDKTITWIDSTDSWTSNQTFSSPNLTLTSLSAQNSEATALMINGSNVVGTRDLGSAAFSATSDFATASHNHSLDSLSNTTITSNASGEILKWNGSAWINNTLSEAGIASASTLSSHTGNTSNPHSVTASQVGAYTSTETDTLLNAKQNTLTFGISNTNAVKIDSASVADNEYARFTANGLESRSTSEVKSDIGLGNVVNQAITVTSSSVSDGTNTFNKATLASLGTDAFDNAGEYANLRAQATTKDDVGLGSVENTALSTWAGSSNITTVGASAVTAHEASLSITESQISDFGSYSTTSHNHALDSLSNVTITSNASGEILKWNGSAWVNNTLAEAGIATSSHTHDNANSTSAGFMSDAHYDKLEGIADNANNYSLPEATATVRGGIELFSDTDQGVAANTVSSTAGRTYGIQLNSAGQAVVNVPWSDTNTVYTHPTHAGDDISIDTGPLTGATVISDLDFNITTNALGHVTDANGTIATRTLTPANIGAAPLESPALTGNPTAPTPSTSDNDTSIATTAFVKAQNYITASSTNTLTNKTWNGNVIASSYLDEDTAHLSGTQTFSGAKTFSSDTTFNGKVGIGVTPSSAEFEVNGHFAATTKSFIVDNPKTGGKLQYGVVESDQHSVFVRGKNDTNTIELPEEWEWLVDEDSVTVQLTSIGQMQQLFVISQDNKTIKIGGLATNGKYNYTVYGERKDVEKLKVNI